MIDGVGRILTARVARETPTAQLHMALMHMLLVPCLIIRQLYVHLFRASSLAPQPILSSAPTPSFLRTGGWCLHNSDRVTSLDKLRGRTA